MVYLENRTYFYKLKVQIDSSEELLSFTKKGSAIYSGILNLINYKAQGLIDWKNTSKLSFNSKLEDHHIFPKEYIRAEYKTDEDALDLIDSVANRTLIPKITNIKIGKKAPSKYLKQLEESNPTIQESLQQHLVPEGTLEGLYDSDYRYFLEERANAMFGLVEQYVIDLKGKVLEEFYQEPNFLKSKGESISVFATYYDMRVDAEFHLETKQILYKGELLSVSTAGSTAKKDLTGKETSTNGWQFWRFIDEQNQERFIEVLRNDQSVIKTEDSNRQESEQN